MNKQNLIRALKWLLFGSLVFFAGYSTSHTYLYTKGFETGYSQALDTVSTIIRETNNSDSTITELKIINPDTVTYYLSPKRMYK
jgi:hypothetical protein